MAINVPPPSVMTDPDLAIFRDTAARFLDRHAPREKLDQWRRDGIIPRQLWTRAGEDGLLGLSTATEYGGAGGDFRHEIVLIEELGKRGRLPHLRRHERDQEITHFPDITENSVNFVSRGNNRYGSRSAHQTSRLSRNANPG